MRHLDLFTGIGGFAYAAQTVWGDDYELVATCEIDSYCQRVIQKHWPGTPNHNDITKMDGKQYAGTIELISGGFPCQPFSTAARGRIRATTMWPCMLRVVNKIMPAYVVVENVAKAPLLLAEEDLRQLGYFTALRRQSAISAGAWHKRNRWWLCAYTDHESELYRTIDAKMAELQKLCENVWTWENYSEAIRVSNGISNRVDRLRGLGNAIVPQVAMAILQAIKESEML